MSERDDRKGILCNPTLAAECARRIDLTDFGTVRRHAKSPESPISFVMLLSEEYRLEELAALCLEPSEFQEAMILGLMTSKVLRFAVSGMPDIDDGILRIPVDQIPEDQPCDVVYMPPAFLVQLRTN